MTMAQQVLDGDVLYRDAADNRSPLVPYVKAFIFALFGDWNAFAVHTSLAFGLGCCAAILGWIGLRLGGPLIGLATSLCFVILQSVYIGATDSMTAHTEWFVLIFSTLAFALLTRARNRPSFRNGLPIGFFFGLSTLSKQPGILDFLVACFVLIFLGFAAPRERKTLLRWAAGMMVAIAGVMGAVSLYFAIQGAHADYIYYAFTFNTQVYVPEYPLTERILSIGKTFSMAKHHAPLIGVIVAAGAFVAVPHVIRRTMSPGTTYPLLPLMALGWFCSGLVAATLGGRGFAHYSTTVIPGACLLFGWAVGTSLGKITRWRFRAGIAVSILLATAVLFQFARQYRAAAQDLKYVDHRYPALALPVIKHSQPDERIFVWGYIPELYFYAHRLPATRYIYTNFVTGLLPWTNIDPLTDVSYAIVPDAPKHLANEFRTNLPALVVDTRSEREYSRFPIARQNDIWPLIVAHYAEVALPEVPTNSVRYFRRLDPTTPDSQDVSWTRDSRLTLSGFDSPEENESPQLEVRGPRGFDRIELVVNGQVTAALSYPKESAINLRFFIADEPLAASRVSVRAMGPAGRIESVPFDFSNYARSRAALVPAGPVMKLGQAKIRPVKVVSKKGIPTPSPTNDETWDLHAPARLEFAYPASLNWVSFRHGIDHSILDVSDGCDFAANWIGPDGAKRRIWEKRNSHESDPGWQDPQSEVIQLPSLPPGILEFEFTHGRFGHIHHDRFFMGSILGETGIPFITIGENWIPAQSAGNEPFSYLSGHGPGRWQLPPDRDIQWNVPELLKSLEFEFGVDDAFFNSETQTPPQTFAVIVDLLTNNGERTTLFRRNLDPQRNNEHRGPQRTKINLPQSSERRLSLRIDSIGTSQHGHQHTWVGNFRGHSVGPSFQIDSERYLSPLDVEGHSSLWAELPHADRWNAHPPQQLTYQKPKELRRITVSYGMFADSVRKQAGYKTSDGVTFVVGFVSPTGEFLELHRRDLNPFLNPEDNGTITAEIELPIGETGELILRVEAGENDSWDWAYWDPITGETTRADSD